MEEIPPEHRTAMLAWTAAGLNRTDTAAKVNATFETDYSLYDVSDVVDQLKTDMEASDSPSDLFAGRVIKGPASGALDSILDF